MAPLEDAGPAKTVLVVDDVSEIRAVLRAYLHDPPRMAVIGEAADGLAAIRVAGELQPDVIVLDRLMDPMGGDAALPRLRAALPDAVIVIYSSFADPADRQMLADLGADDLVDKRAGLDRLQAAIGTALSTRATEPADGRTDHQSR
ncbi:MAG TPA: response regulator transcription factor [Acidimicrobiales bacterium]|nr:response regulator transcription factor [Acidimicrobiales bacterium]